jgi:glutamate-1-semialdehyde 2,1-aminomutase
MAAIDRHRLNSLMDYETKKFVDERPQSAALFERARRSLLGGVPMNWMAKWAGAFPPFVAEAHGAEVVDVDGRRYVDFCLGDTGAMTGHSPASTVAAAQQQLARGITFMLPNEDAICVAEELQRRFGLPCWQFALSATDANRFSIRLARQITGPSQNSSFQLVLSRHRGRDIYHPERRRIETASRKCRPTGRSVCHYKGY